MTKSREKNNSRDHGGGLDAAVAQFGGARKDWLDLSTGINPNPYPSLPFSLHSMTALPDQGAYQALIEAARKFWSVPQGAKIVPAAGASALIAALPALIGGQKVAIAQPTYNEHQAAFIAAGWALDPEHSDVQVAVHPNNPDGYLWQSTALQAPMAIIDESFADVCPDQSLIGETARPGRIVLKSFGKFWGLAGVRLGFAIGADPVLDMLAERLGPWPVSGPALDIGTAALNDKSWAENTRIQLAKDARRLDQILLAAGAEVVGGCDLFRLFSVKSAEQWHQKLAQHHILSRIFPYSDHYLRLGLPSADGWDRLQRALS
ncbi:MAG: pyridoxal phosphate-dependent class II aminotransferase [Marinovum sp.]|nr:pyridoxal phosphate-dependent class II aminotransferase [Marinovum sp.]